MHKKAKLLALVAVASSLAVGAGSLAAPQTNPTTITTKTATQKKDFKEQPGGSRTERLIKLSEEFWLTASQKAEFEKLATQLQTERKAYHEKKKAASTQEEKNKLKTQREQRKSELKNQILALVPAEQKSKVESLLSKPKHWSDNGEGKGKGKEQGKKGKRKSDANWSSAWTTSPAKKQKRTTTSAQS